MFLKKKNNGRIFFLKNTTDTAKKNAATKKWWTDGEIRILHSTRFKPDLPKHGPMSLFEKQNADANRTRDVNEAVHGFVHDFQSEKSTTIFRNMREKKRKHKILIGFKSFEAAKWRNHLRSCLVFPNFTIHHQIHYSSIFYYSSTTTSHKAHFPTRSIIFFGSVLFFFLSKLTQQ